MIKITKPGQKEFHGFCKWCGCEFTYEISDLKLSASSDKLDCPTCGKTYYHPSVIQSPTIPGGIDKLIGDRIVPTVIPADNYDPDSCADCTWREHLLRNGTYVGDTPCTWCNKNRFNNITCSTPPLNGAIQGNDISLKTYLTDYTEDDSVCAYPYKEVPGTYTTAHNGGCDDTEGHNSCSNEHKCSGNKNCKGKH